MSVLGQSSTDESLLALQLYSSVQYSVNRFSISRSSVRHFPERSWAGVAFPCFTVVKCSQIDMPSYCSRDVILCGWLGSKYQLTNKPSYCCSSSDVLQSHYTVLTSSFLLPFSCTSRCCSLPCISQILQVHFVSFSVLSLCRTDK